MEESQLTVLTGAQIGDDRGTSRLWCNLPCYFAVQFCRSDGAGGVSGRQVSLWQVSIAEWLCRPTSGILELFSFWKIAPWKLVDLDRDWESDHKARMWQRNPRCLCEIEHYQIRRVIRWPRRIINLLYSGIVHLIFIKQEQKSQVDCISR